MNKKAIIIVLDSVGIGELPDAAAYGDKGADTLGHWYAFFPLLCVVEGLDDDNAPEPERNPNVAPAAGSSRSV